MPPPWVEMGFRTGRGGFASIVGLMAVMKMKVGMGG